MKYDKIDRYIELFYKYYFKAFKIGSNSYNKWITILICIYSRVILYNSEMITSLIVMSSMRKFCDRLCRNWEGGHMGLYIGRGRKLSEGLGGLSRKYLKK